MKPLEDIQKTNVTLKMLIDSQILHAGQEIFCANPNISGVLNHDGSMTVNINGRDRVFSYPSGAARHIEKKSLNGWLYWYVIIDGENQTLGSFRDHYLKKMDCLKSH